jgi:hypothetical protein
VHLRSLCSTTSARAVAATVIVGAADPHLRQLSKVTYLPPPHIMADNYDEEQFLWPQSDSPLFVPHSPSTPPHFTFPQMQHQPTRRNPAPQRSGAQQVKYESRPFASLNSSFASGAGSGLDSASSSISSTPQSSFSMRSRDSQHQSRGKRPTRRSQSLSQGRAGIVEEGESSSRSSKRRRVEVESNEPLASNNSFMGDDFNLDVEWENMEFYGDEEREVRPEIIDLTDDSPAITHTAREVQAARGLESLARITQRSTRVEDIGNYSLPTGSGTLGSRAAPIFIDEEESPARVTVQATVQQADAQREASVEVLEHFVARQHQEAVAAQFSSNGEQQTSFNNMTCVICMDVPRNLSMVPCGKSQRVKLG